ncbi:MAG: hypothetical protein P8100_06890 [bacterium]
MGRLKRHIILLLIFSGIISSYGQDIIVKTNGAQINAKVIEITDDSVRFKNKTLAGNPIFTLPRSDIKVIEYWNGKKLYLRGSYTNISEQDSSSYITGVKSKQYNVFIEGIAFHVERLFTEYRLVMDYSRHPDTNFIISKGKIEFEFEETRENFFIKYFPTGKKTAFSKFTVGEEGENKRFGKLSNELLKGMAIYYDDSVSQIQLDSLKAIELREMFSGRDIRYQP